jgi:hypothetical protein|tara:strand:- start:92 stop:673 length:582 start_codon:yes stop_codon:yes gene_type:complete
MEEIQQARQIKEDVRLWSKHYLEIPNKHLGGYPACPFAKMAWLQDKVQIEIKPKFLSYKKELNDYIYTLDFAVKEILIFCDPFYSYTPNQFHQITEEYNNKYNKIDMYFMSFHPNNPATTEEQAFLVEPEGHTPDITSDLKYSMMLVQKFSQLQEASDKLHKQGYYKKWPREYYEDVVGSRKLKYKNIKGDLS